jgi:hypothetical protein
MSLEIPLTLTRTDAIQDGKVTLPYVTPLDEMARVQAYQISARVDSTEDLPDTPPTYERSLEYYVSKMMIDEDDWSFARVLRQFLIAGAASLVSIATSLGRWVDDSIKKKYRGYLVTVDDFPAGRTNVSAGEVERYMPLGWVAFYYEVNPDIGDPVRYYGPITWLYTIHSVVFTLDPRYSGLHVEPSVNVSISVTEL